MKKPILITGCPRSGTRFASLMMRYVFDMMIGHEIELGHGTADWRFVDPRFDKKKFKVILHQVRYPLDVINSLHTITEQSESFMKQNIVTLIRNGDRPLHRYMKFWYYWVMAAERMADFTYRVEDAKESLKKIGKLIDVKAEDLAIYRVSKEENTRKNNKKYGDVVWEDLEKIDEKLCDKIIDLTKRLGY